MSDDGRIEMDGEAAIAAAWRVWASAWHGVRAINHAGFVVAGCAAPDKIYRCAFRINPPWNDTDWTAGVFVCSSFATGIAPKPPSIIFGETFGREVETTVHLIVR